MNDDAPKTYNTSIKIKFKNTMLKSSPFNQSDFYILVKGTIKIIGAQADAAERNACETSIQVTFKNLCMTYPLHQ